MDKMLDAKYRRDFIFYQVLGHFKESYSNLPVTESFGKGIKDIATLKAYIKKFLDYRAPLNLFWKSLGSKNKRLQSCGSINMEISAK